MEEHDNPLYTCQYNPGNLNSLQNNIKQQTESQPQSINFEYSIPTTNPKIKIIQQYGQQQEKQQIQQSQPQQTIQPISQHQSNFNLNQSQRNNKNILESDIAYNQTIYKTKTTSCIYCSKLINQNSILLPCFHQYHKECLNELIINNINIEQATILCMCRLTIPQSLILEQFQDREQRKKYFIIQLYEIISNAPSFVQQRLLGQQKQNQQSLKNLLNTLMVVDDTPQKIIQN